jgi:hypothetical protein
MKRLLIVALLAGCAGSTPVASTTPTPEIIEAPTQANQYEGVFGFLNELLTLNAETFEALCGEVGGEFSITDNYYVCLEDGTAGFSIQVVAGATKGSSVLVPGSDGQALANALVEDVGAPTFAAGGSAGWELDGFVLIFGSVGNAWIVVLERTGVAL